nr:MAG TPA: hypothetical protein [Caudoviricetes sp.]
MFKVCRCWHKDLLLTGDFIYVTIQVYDKVVGYSMICESK